jgi:hypothetical protein
MDLSLAQSIVDEFVSKGLDRNDIRITKSNFNVKQA